MGKKRKTKSLLQNFCKQGSSSQDSSLLDEVIQNLPKLREAGGLVVGFNATVRKIEKGGLSLALFISRQGTSAMYHALHSLCKERNVLFLSLNDINIFLSSSKLPTSSVYGIQDSVLQASQFSSLLGKINQAKALLRNCKNKKKDVSQPEVEVKEVSTEQTDEGNEVPSQVKEVTHPKHRTVSGVKHSGGGESFLSLNEMDFPDYGCKLNLILSVDVKRS